MDKDRLKGRVRQTIGAMKQAVGRASGDRKTEAEGAIEKSSGASQSALGRAKDRLRRRLRK